MESTTAHSVGAGIVNSAIEPQNFYQTQMVANDLRAEIQTVADKILKEKKVLLIYPPQVNEDRDEVIANIMLAYRHLEDAKMRLGKVIQAVEGVSIYDTKAK